MIDRNDCAGAVRLSDNLRHASGVPWMRAKINPRSRRESPGISMTAVSCDLFPAHHQRLLQTLTQAINLSVVAGSVVIRDEDKIQAGLPRGGN